jgi:hypothetical protein
LFQLLVQGKKLAMSNYLNLQANSFIESVPGKATMQVSNKFTTPWTRIGLDSPILLNFDIFLVTNKN